MIHTWELVAYSWVFVCSIFVVCCCVVLFSKRKSYPPFGLPDVFILIVASLCGQIHSWATLLSAIDFSIWPWMRLEDAPYCSLWNYWAPYFLGLNGWICLLVFRVFLRRTKTENKNTLKIPCFVTLGLLTLTMAAICTCGTVTACDLCPYSKIFLVSWTGAALTVLFILWVYMEKKIRHHHLAERIQIRIFVVCTVIAFLLVVIPGIIFATTSLKLIEAIAGDPFLAFVVPAFHMFFAVIFIFPHSFRAWREDTTYSRRLFVGLFNRNAEATSIFELSASDAHMELFLNWCAEQGSICEEGGVIKRNPNSYVSCYRQIQIWEAKWNDDGRVNEREMTEMREVICDTYFKTSSNEIIPLGTRTAKKMNATAVSRTTFSPAKVHVLTFFQRYFWRSFVQNFKAMGYAQELEGKIEDGEDLGLEDGYSEMLPLTPLTSHYADGRRSPRKKNYQDMEDSSDGDDIIVYTDLDNFQEFPTQKKKRKKVGKVLNQIRKKKKKKQQFFA